MKTPRYEIVELAGRETRMFWLLDNVRNKVAGKWPTREIAEDELAQLEILDRARMKEVKA